MTRTGSYVRPCSTAALLVSLLTLSAPAAVAQPSVLVVSGTVRDLSAAVLPAAVVDALAAGRLVATAVTAADGRYRLEVPARVPVTLRVRRDGFAEHVAQLPGGTADVTRDVTLQVGGVSDTLVVTASRAPEGRASVTSSVTVLTSADVHALGASGLDGVLRFVPGVAVESNGREGGPASLFSRGGESDYNLVLIDGVRANVQGGGFDVSRISGAEIERVEVVRGAQSALWGSDAMGAVVQVFTRRADAAEAPRLFGAVEAGTFDTQRGDVRVAGGARGRVDYHGGVTYRKTDGAFADILPEDDWFEAVSFDGGAGARLGSRASLRTAIRYGRSQGRSVSNITFGARNRGGVYDTTQLSWHADLAHSAGARFTGTGTVNVFRYEQESADTVADTFTTYAILSGTPDALYPGGVRLVRVIERGEFDALSAAGAAPGVGQFLASGTSFDFQFASRTRFRRPAVRYQGDYAWAAAHRLSAGYEWERESFPLDPLNAATTGFGLDNHALFVQQQSTFADRLFLTVGARVDSKERYDTYVSPKLSAGAYLVPVRAGRLSSVKVFGNVGRGIKSPNFSERFGGPFGDPNPELKVEQARTADVGVEATFASGRLRSAIAYFDNDYTDQIAFRFGPVGDGVPENINIDGSQARGMELELALQRSLRGFTAAAGYAYVDTEVVTSLSTSQQFQPGQPLLRRPRHSGTLRAAYTRARATVNLDVRIVGDRHDNSFLFLQTVPNAQYPSSFFTDITVNPGYTVAGLGLDYRIDRSFTVFVRGNNITDAEYDGALGYPGLPRSVMVGAQFDLRR